MRGRPLPAAILIAALAGTTLLRGRVDQAAMGASFSPTVYVSSGETLRHFTFGYEGLLADWYWTRSVQYFGRARLSGGSHFELLAPLLRATVTLDPQLLIAYRFGAIFLAEKPPSGAGQPQEALALIRRGIGANPGYWRLWQDLGFVYYWDLKDYKHAALAFEAGSRVPGAAVWMKTLAASIAAKGGELDTSRLLWTEVLREAGNDTIRRGAVEHLAAIRAAQDMDTINRALAVFEQRTGHLASGIRDLVQAGLLRQEPVDPAGAPYVIGHDAKAALGSGSTIDLALAK
jgi:hypothetical protein